MTLVRTRATKGQSSVEFALIVPLVLVVLLLAVQVAITAHAQLAVTHLAREVARALAADPGVDVDDLVARTSPIGAKGLVVEVQIEPAGPSGHQLIHVFATHESSPIVEIFAPFSEYFTVRAETVMLSEP